MATAGNRQSPQINAFLKALLVAAVVFFAFWLAGRFLGPRLGPGWTDVLQGGGGLVALIVLAVAAVVGMRRAARR